MPDTSSVHFDVALTNVSIAYRNSAFVAPIVAPEVAVRRQSDRYFLYDSGRESFRRSIDFRAPGTEANEVGFALSSDSYYCDDHALESAIPDEERDNADAPLQPEVDRVEFLTEKILLNQEIALADALLASGALPDVDLAGTSAPWSDDAIDPLDSIEAARNAILAATQQVPNTLVLSQAAFTALRNNAKIVDRIRYASAGAIGAQALGGLLDLPQVLVARAVRNTAAAGQAATMAPIWGTHALLLYLPPRASLKCVAPVLTFAWGQAGGSSRGVSVQTWREERRKSTMVRVQKYYDQKVVAAGAAYLFRNATA